MSTVHFGPSALVQLLITSMLISAVKGDCETLLPRRVKTQGGILAMFTAQDLVICASTWQYRRWSGYADDAAMAGVTRTSPDAGAGGPGLFSWSPRASSSGTRDDGPSWLPSSTQYHREPIQWWFRWRCDNSARMAFLTPCDPEMGRGSQDPSESCSPVSRSMQAGTACLKGSAVPAARRLGRRMPAPVEAASPSFSQRLEVWENLPRWRDLLSPSPRQAGLGVASPLIHGDDEP
jgi:hypothetical protein